jgi:putative tryptophan/tyrosine transport system substrate-binding protein
MRRRSFITLLGGAAAWPIAALAQQPLIGFMSSRSPEDSVDVVAAFRRGLGERGMIEGRNVLTEFRWARGQYARLPALAAELVSRPVSVLVAAGGPPAAYAAKAATSTIPILFVSTDPVKSGLVASMNRPGGNATGVHLLTTELEAKRLGLLHELLPGSASVGALLNPTYPAVAQQEQELAEAARTVGRTIAFLNASTDAEIDAAFADLARQRVAGVVVASDPFFDTRRDQIIALAAHQKLPAIYQFREYAVAGGLTSYGVSLYEAYRNIGDYAGRIVNGANPADLPVMQSVKFELVIEAAFAALVQKRADALIVGADPLFIDRRVQLATLATRHLLPAVYFLREFVESGGLMSYGPSNLVRYRELGIYTGRVLKGEKPADMPVVQPTRFELVINLPTARAIGIAVPPSLLAQADEVIE